MEICHDKTKSKDLGNNWYSRGPFKVGHVGLTVEMADCVEQKSPHARLVEESLFEIGDLQGSM